MHSSRLFALTLGALSLGANAQEPAPAPSGREADGSPPPAGR